MNEIELRNLPTIKKEMQEFIVIALFIAAGFFLAKRLYDNIRHKKVNAGCAKCDMNEINK